MAKIGLKAFYYAKVAEDDVTNGIKYEETKRLVGAIESNFSPELAEAELYADDELAEYAAEFSKGVLTLGVKHDDDKIFADFLGNQTSEVSDGEAQTKTVDVTQKSTDIGAYYGFAQIVPVMVNNVRKYKAECFLKIRMKPYSRSRKTKGNSLEFTTPSVEGIVFTTAKDSAYERHATFSTAEAAENYIKTTVFEKKAS